MANVDPARKEILARVRWALDRPRSIVVGNLPSSTRIAPRSTGDVNQEIGMLMDEIAKLGGHTCRLARRADIEPALQQLVETEGIRKATCWPSQNLEEIGIVQMLTGRGVEIVSPSADKYALADCDLGVTGFDAALPETGTILLRSSAEQPRQVSLLPRVHLAIGRPSALRSDVGPALALVKASGYYVFITGPSRTSDIELTVTIGVHGPKALHVWMLEESLPVS